MLYINSRVRFADVIDGTSQTVIFGERPPTALGGWAGWWFAGGGFYPWFGAVDVVLGSNEKIGSLATGACTPNDPQSFYQPPTRPYTNEENAWHFWSFYPGGASFAFVDGHVGFTSYTVDEKILPAVATRDGGEVIDGQIN